MRYTIMHKELAITVDSHGAQAISVKYKGIERLWQNEDGSWAESAPVLFPVSSSCRMLVDGKDYQMPFHGFAKDCEFALSERSQTCLKFTLRQNDKTKLVYPFDFIFNVIYSVEDGIWKIDYEIINPSNDKVLYVSCGGHESYRLEENVEQYYLEFEKEEDFQTLLVRPDGLIDEETYSLGFGKILPIPETFMKRCAVNFVGIRSRKVTLKHIDGRKIAETTFDGFDVFLLWHPWGSKMICLEPWLNLPDDVYRDKQEFSQKRGVLKIKQKETKLLSRTIRYF